MPKCFMPKYFMPKFIKVFHAKVFHAKVYHAKSVSCQSVTEISLKFVIIGKVAWTMACMGKPAQYRSLLGHTHAGCSNLEGFSQHHCPKHDALWVLKIGSSNSWPSCHRGNCGTKHHGPRASSNSDFSKVVRWQDCPWKNSDKKHKLKPADMSKRSFGCSISRSPQILA